MLRDRTCFLRTIWLPQNSGRKIQETHHSKAFEKLVKGASMYINIFHYRLDS